MTNCLTKHQKKDLACFLLDAFAVVVLMLLCVLTAETLEPTTAMMFYCNDPAINYPWRPSTVSPMGLMIVAVFVPTLIIFLVELVIPKYRESHPECYINCVAIPFHKYFARPAHIVFSCGLGLMFQRILVEIIKVVHGKPRPHFLELCGLSSEICANSTSKLFEIADCPATDVSTAKWINARKSFPSGHAATSQYTTLWLSLYLHSRLSLFHKNSFSLSAVHVLLQVLTSYNAISRIFDYKHHTEDVLWGMIIGAGVALLTFKLTTPQPILPKVSDEVGQSLQIMLGDEAGGDVKRV